MIFASVWPNYFRGVQKSMTVFELASTKSRVSDRDPVELESRSKLYSFVNGTKLYERKWSLTLLDHVYFI